MTRTKARTKIWEIKVHLHQTVHQIQVVESSETSELTRTKALTMIWVIRVHLHRKGHQLQVLEPSKTSEMTHTGSDGDVVNQIPSTPNRPWTPNQVKPSRKQNSKFMVNLKGRKTTVRTAVSIMVKWSKFQKDMSLLFQKIKKIVCINFQIKEVAISRFSKKLVFLKISQNSQEFICAGAPFLIKLHTSARNFI